MKEAAASQPTPAARPKPKLFVPATATQPSPAARTKLSTLGGKGTKRWMPTGAFVPLTSSSNSRI